MEGENMKNKLICIIILFFICIGFSWTFNVIDTYGQSIDENKTAELEEWINSFEHPSWRERDKALDYGISKHLDDKRAQIALMNRLKKETMLIKQKKVDEEGEGYFEYYMNLLEAVTKLDDKRIVPLLVDSFGIVGGNAVPEKLSEFGDYAAKHILQKLGNRNRDVRDDAVFALNKLLKKKTVTKKMRNQIKKELIIKATKDEDQFVRRSAIKGLEILSDKDVIPIIKKIAKEDPYSIKIVKTGRMKYPVRDAAKKALEKLKAKKPEE